MKKLLVAILMVILLTGCVTVESKPRETPTPKPLTSEQAYVQNLRNQLPTQTRGVPDQDLIDTGEAACGALDRGVTFDQIVRETMDQGIDPGFAGGIVGAAVRDLCPEYQSVLDQYLDSTG